MLGGWRKQQSRDIQVLGKHALENEAAFGSERATSECWSQISCGSWLHVWNTATLKFIYRCHVCMDKLFSIITHILLKKRTPGVPHDNAVDPLSHNTSSPSLEADIEGRWAEDATATAGSSAHSLGWSIDAWMDTSSLPSSKCCAIPLLCVC